MKILGIESAAMVAGAALLENDRIIAEYTVNLKQTHSQTLLPMIDEIIRVTGIDKKELDAIAVSAGPGSYTGLRIGSATAKGLGLALKKPVVSVPTLAAMAYQCYGSGREVSPIMDARRGQVYTALYRFGADGTMITEEEPQVILMEEWMKKLEERGGQILFTGDGIPVFGERILQVLPGSLLAPAHMNRERAASVASLGALLYQEGKTETAAEHLPVYLRKPQAEREREERAAQQNG
ncbi:MAG: tRNA (adenosine(37)-N6)-threonylcarbamoyltransferase complex dimerization subunit type 1 TsaB [Lachnospiraceae bacterium]|nr:tRNA (adenosine(37)-N6)-threonylcarbamoyltransferase complex dimerization subunit type 1 TsaB [Lachnospiraceae bacterium]